MLTYIFDIIFKSFHDFVADCLISAFLKRSSVNLEQDILYLDAYLYIRYNFSIISRFCLISAFLKRSSVNLEQGILYLDAYLYIRKEIFDIIFQSFTILSQIVLYRLS